MRLLPVFGRSRADEQRTAGDRGFAPIAIVEVELSAPLRPIPATDAAGRRYGTARVLVRLHSKPLGMLELEVGADGVDPAACADAIWSMFARKINAHLRDDMLDELDGIDPRGLSETTPAACLSRREALLRDAPAASVIVCTRNRAAMLARSLRSLEDLAYPNFDVIVVDGSAGRETADLISEEFPRVRYLSVGSNGLSVARNRGVAAASGAIAAFTDDDVLVDRYWLAELVGALQEHDRAACATGLVLPLEIQTPAQLWFEESGAFTEGFDRRVIDLQAPRPRGSLLPYATGRIGAGVSMAWRVSVLRELGGFDVALDTLTPPWPPRSRNGSSGEDVAAFFDALISGYQIVYEPNAIVYHEHRRTYDELARQLYWHGIGLGAYLTRCIAVQPRRIPDFLNRVPRGVFYGFAARSQRNREKTAAFPSGLTRAERRGVVHGPFAYFRGLPMARRLRAAERRLAPDVREEAATQRAAS